MCLHAQSVSSKEWQEHVSEMELLWVLLMTQLMLQKHTSSASLQRGHSGVTCQFLAPEHFSRANAWCKRLNWIHIIEWQTHYLLAVCPRYSYKTGMFQKCESVYLDHVCSICTFNENMWFTSFVFGWCFATIPCAASLQWHNCGDITAAPAACQLQAAQSEWQTSVLNGSLLNGFAHLGLRTSMPP